MTLVFTGDHQSQQIAKSIHIKLLKRTKISRTDETSSPKQRNLKMNSIEFELQNQWVLHQAAASGNQQNVQKPGKLRKLQFQ
jgi:hypothetical protein